MRFIISFMVWNLTFVNGNYDPKSAIEQRIRHLKTVCDKYRTLSRYSDRRKVQHGNLFDEVKDPSANYIQNIASKFFICVPPDNGALAWNRFLRQVHNFDLKKHGTKNASFAMTTEKMNLLFMESHRSIVIQHPLIRVLSTYLTLFQFSDAHIMSGMTNNVKLFWLEKRRDPLAPTKDEKNLDSKSRPTITFRQFVNFLTKCPEEIKQCELWFQNKFSFGLKWNPMWSYCHPCLEDMEPTSILELQHLNEDKDYVFDQIKFDYTFTWEIKKSENHPVVASDVKTQKEYFSTLLKQEIYDLYLKYQLDHDLFGYKPDLFLEMGKKQ